MNTNNYTHLQIREIFHIEFLRALARGLKPVQYALKGGVNMRLFFGSVRYSEDIDLDIRLMSVSALRDSVMKILGAPSFRSQLASHGISDILPPNLSTAKQTETTQRFKIHLITHQGEDLFTKVKFSRRPGEGRSAAEIIPDAILRPYKIPPVIVNHYDAPSAFAQKVHALINRSAVQARDIFDLHVLSPRISGNDKRSFTISRADAKKAEENIFSVDFRQFRDSVLSYLDENDRAVYDTQDIWDEIKLKVHELICAKD